MRQHIRNFFSSIANYLKRQARHVWSNIALVVIAAVLVELTSAIQYYYARKQIFETVRQNAETELKVKSLEIQKVMTAVETATDNLLWFARQRLNQPDSLFTVSRRLVEQNNTIVGAALIFTMFDL